MKKLYASVTTFLTAGVIILNPLCNMSQRVNALSYDFTVHTFGELEYRKYSDHIAISGFDTEYTSAEIPAKLLDLPVTEIAHHAFADCTELESVELPYGLEEIGLAAFQNCTSLTEIVFPDSITAIGGNAFENCTSLTEVTIPDSLESIPTKAFIGCTALEKINLHEGVTDIGSEAFDGTAWYENQPDGIVYINRIAHSYKGEMPADTEIVFRDDTEVIGEFLFSECPNIISAVLPESVKRIEIRAFADCINLESVTIKNPDCDIYDFAHTFFNYWERKPIGGNYYLSETVFNGTLYGYENSTTQSYAERFKRNFSIIGESENKLQGDINADGKFSAADLVMLQKWLLNSGEVKDWQAGDMDKNEILDVFDIIQMKNALIA